MTIIKDKINKKSKGFGFITYVNEVEAKLALNEMNEIELVSSTRYILPIVYY